MAKDNKEEKSLFDTNNAEQAAAPRLREYIRVSGTGVYILIGALILVLVATVVWGLIGTIPVTMDVKGYVQIALYNSEEEYQNAMASPSDARESTSNLTTLGDLKDYTYILAFVNPDDIEGKDLSGKEVTITFPDKTKAKGYVDFASNIVTSREDYRKVVPSEWFLDACFPSDYAYPISVQSDEDLVDHFYDIVSLSIVVDEKHPIEFLMQ